MPLERGLNFVERDLHLIGFFTLSDTPLSHLYDGGSIVCRATGRTGRFGLVKGTKA